MFTSFHFYVQSVNMFNTYNFGAGYNIPLLLLTTQKNWLWGKRENEGNFFAVFRARDDFADFLHDSTKCTFSSGVGFLMFYIWCQGIMDHNYCIKWGPAIHFLLIITLIITSKHRHSSAKLLPEQWKVTEAIVHLSCTCWSKKISCFNELLDQCLCMTLYRPTTVAHIISLR